eukprot:403353411
MSDSAVGIDQTLDKSGIEEEDESEDKDGEAQSPLQYPETEPIPFQFSWRKLWAFSGPGLLMSIAYLDPGNIAGDLGAGNVAGYRLLWILLSSTALGLFFQILAARLGVVTQRNLARLCREQYPKHVRIILWLMTEIAIIGSDIQEVIGSSIAFNILFGLPIWAGAIITILDSIIFLFIHYFGVRKLEGFFALLIGTMAVCFFVNLFIVKPDIGPLLFGTFVPTIPEGSGSQAIGLIGAVIMPHNLYLHSSLVLSRKVNNKNQKQVHEANIYNAVESGISLFVSFMINFAVVATFAFYHNKGFDDLNLRNADQALYSSFGDAARIIWGVGLLAAGQSSTMTGTYCGQFVMEGFFDIKLPVWKRVLVTRSIAIMPALAVAFMQDFDDVDNYLNILQSVQLPFALVPLLKFTSSDLIMGRFKNSKCVMIFAILTAFCLFVINAIGLVPIGVPGWVYAPFSIVFALYIGLIIIVLRAPLSPIMEHKDSEIDEGFDKVIIADFDTSTKATNKN